MVDGLCWILFDAVGTLIFPDPPVAQVYHSAARRFGSKLSKEEIGRRFLTVLAASFDGNLATNATRERDRWRSMVAAVVDDVPGHEDHLFEQLWNHFAQPWSWKLYDDVAASLEGLSQRGFRLGIASNFDGRLKKIAAGHAVLQACVEVFVSSDLGFTKPDPRFFRAIERQLGISGSQILLVGDDEIQDFQAANAAGWQAIWLCRDGGHDQRSIRSLAAVAEKLGL